jgi:hypothetical protein
MAKTGKANWSGEVCAEMEFELKSCGKRGVILLRRAKRLKDREIRADDCIDGSLIIVSVRNGAYTFRAQPKEPKEAESEVRVP